jgi:hypothetical protein
VILLEKQIVALILIVLVAGLGVGYALSYAVYQPQIDSLKSGIDGLMIVVNSFQSSLNNLQNRISTLNSTVTALTAPNETTPSDNETSIVEPFENLEFLSFSATKNGANFDLTFIINNTGTTPVYIELLALNGNPLYEITDLSHIEVNGTEYASTDPVLMMLRVGDGQEGKLTLVGGDTFKSGTIVSVLFQTMPMMNRFQQSTTLP